MGEVNGRRESRPLESDSEPPAPFQGAQASTKNRRIPGLFRPDDRAERVLPESVLAEGEELWSNTLNVRFQIFSITVHLMD
jgi:hypothetical protein